MENKDRYKICIFYHVPERELNSCLLIADKIKKLRPGTDVIVNEFYHGVCLALLYRPDVILTIPPRDSQGAQRLTILKKIVKCSILSLLTEGFYQSFSEDHVQIAIGTNTYSSKLIDKYLFWGEKTREHFVHILKKNKKIEDVSRSQTVGYVYYDMDAIQEYFKEDKTLDEVWTWGKNFVKTILVLTGFPLAEYTKNEQIIMSAFKYYGIKGKEKEYERELREWKEKKNAFLDYRKRYLDCIVQFAKNHPDIGVIVKLHPVELESFSKGNKYQCYRELEKNHNIIILKENFLLGRILPHIELLVHYGSTSGLEAYIYDIPTVQLYDSKYDGEIGAPGFCIYESTVRVDVNEPKLFDKIIYAGIDMRYSESVERVLKDQFNWTKDKKNQYHPVEAYARIILASVGDGQRMEDTFYRSAIESDMGYDIKHYFVKRMVKMIVKRKKEEIMISKKILEELGGSVSIFGCLMIELHVVYDKVKRKISRGYLTL